MRLLCKDSKHVDLIMNSKGYSDILISNVFYNQKIRPFFRVALEGNREPAWGELAKCLKGKYSRFRMRKDMLEAHTDFYYRKHEWDKYVTYTMRVCIYDKARFESNADFLNNCAFEVFAYSKKERQLKEALAWVNRAIALRKNAAFLDTRANILYKLGDVNEALVLEQESALLDPHDKVVQLNLQKMKAGEPTWKL